MQENLIPLGNRTEKELKKITSMGGKASVKARRARKTLKEELLALLELNDNQKKISIAMIEKAIKGDTKAFEVVRDTVGEKEPERIINENSEVDKLIKSIDKIKNGNNK